MLRADLGWVDPGLGALNAHAWLSFQLTFVDACVCIYVRDLGAQEKHYSRFASDDATAPEQKPSPNKKQTRRSEAGSDGGESDNNTGMYDEHL